MTYNGWKNRETWNCALWIGNDEGLYRAAVDFARTFKGRAVYRAFLAHMGMERERTPDGILWDGRTVDFAAMNALLRELA